MDKHVKLLVESLFDDFDDIYDDDTDTEDVSAKIQQLSKIESLAECTTLDEINSYLFDKINEDLVKSGGQTLDQWLNSINPNYGDFRNVYTGSNGDLQFGEKIKLSCRQDKSPQMMYRGKMSTFPNTAWIKVHPVVSPEIVWEISNKDVSTQAKKVIDAFNTENSEVRYTNVVNAVLRSIQNAYKTERLLEELSCSGKVYKVVDKDIQRMSKCLSTGNYAGFDAITKPDKMVARLAALFICAKKQGYTNMTLAFNDEILLRVITGYSPYRTKYNKRGDYIGVLTRLQKFPTLHLKDVIATYNAYIDQY